MASIWWTIWKVDLMLAMTVLQKVHTFQLYISRTLCLGVCNLHLSTKSTWCCKHTIGFVKQGNFSSISYHIIWFDQTWQYGRKWAKSEEFGGKHSFCVEMLGNFCKFKSCWNRSNVPEFLVNNFPTWQTPFCYLQQYFAASWRKAKFSIALE